MHKLSSALVLIKLLFKENILQRLCIHPRDYFKTPLDYNEKCGTLVIRNLLFAIYDNRNSEIKIKCSKKLDPGRKCGTLVIQAMGRKFQNLDEPIELNSWYSHETINVLLHWKLDP
uniref:Uncharacterized protein n=1 Tax=Glossina pallidipes TaxID=7398 RepID=A0A1B0A8Z8_GLOPL